MCMKHPSMPCWAHRTCVGMRAGTCTLRKSCDTPGDCHVRPKRVTFTPGTESPPPAPRPELTRLKRALYGLYRVPLYTAELATASLRAHCSMQTPPPVETAAPSPLPTTPPPENPVEDPARKRWEDRELRKEEEYDRELLDSIIL